MAQIFVTMQSCFVCQSCCAALMLDSNWSTIGKCQSTGNQNANSISQISPIPILALVNRWFAKQLKEYSWCFETELPPGIFCGGSLDAIAPKATHVSRISRHFVWQPIGHVSESPPRNACYDTCHCWQLHVEWYEAWHMNTCRTTANRLDDTKFHIQTRSGQETTHISQSSWKVSYTL